MHIINSDNFVKCTLFFLKFSKDPKVDTIFNIINKSFTSLELFEFKKNLDIALNDIYKESLANSMDIDVLSKSLTVEKVKKKKRSKKKTKEKVFLNEKTEDLNDFKETLQNDSVPAWLNMKIKTNLTLV